jgi:1,4-dihydroxy-2-naphthoate polyprenyltransferase
VAALVLAPARSGALLAVLAVPLALPPLQRVRRGALGRQLLPVLRDTGRYQLAYGVLLGGGLALG